MQTNTRHLPATAPLHPNILSGSQHSRSPYNSSRDTPKTSCPRTIQGYNSSPGHSPKTTRSRNTGQDSPKTTRPRTTPSRTFQDNSSQDISTRYMVFQDNRSQDRNHYIQKGSSIVYPCNTKVSVFQFTY